MSDDWVTDLKEGYRTKVVQIGNCTVTVHRPLLDADEQKRREEQVRNALKGLMKKGT